MKLRRLWRRRRSWRPVDVPAGTLIDRGPLTPEEARIHAALDRARCQRRD
jgi:hypothetical protein